MATHFVNSQTKLYRYFTPTSDVLGTLQQQEQITVLEENVGSDCSFYRVVYNDVEGYIKSTNIERLSETPESAPFVCSVTTIPQRNYLEPDWRTLEDNSVFYNERTNEYCAAIIIDHLYMNNREASEQFAKEKGLKALLRYYNKERSEETIQKLLSYYIFCELKDFYVPPRPRVRNRALITVNKRYFDAMPNFVGEPIEIDLSKANFVVRLDAKEIGMLFKNTETILKRYQDDIYFTSSRIQIKTNFDNNEEISITTDNVRETLDLNDEAQKLFKFYDKLVQFLSINGISIPLNKSSSDRAFIELAINDKCNVIYDIAYFNNDVCTKPRIGVFTFLNSDPINNPTTVAFVKNVDRISKIDKCDVSWIEFVETYVYPKTIIQNININDILNNFEQNKYSYANELMQIYRTINAQYDQNPAKTAKEVFQQELDISGFNNPKFWESVGNIFLRGLDKGDNSFQRINLERTLANIEASLGENDPTTPTKILAFDITYNSFKVVEQIGESERQQIGEQNVQFKFSEVDSFEFPRANQNKLELFNKTNPNFSIWTGFDVIIEPVYKTKIQLANREDFFLIKIYDLLNKIGLCKIIDFVSSCVYAIARSFIDINFSATLTVGQIASLSFDEIQNEAIPYLPKEQQELIYNELLLQLPCLTSASLLYILKRALPPEQYAALNIEQAAYQQIASTTSKLMSTSAQ
jgi:hypothetical protein